MSHFQQPVSIHQIKIRNRKLVFKDMQAIGVTNRLEIAKRTHLSAATVSTIVEEFNKKNMIQESKDGKVAIGRKPSLLQFMPETKKTISIDLTSRNMSYAVKRLDLVTTESFMYKYNSNLSYGENLAALCNEIRDLLNRLELDSEVLGIGVSVPGPYHVSQDRVINKLIPEIGEVRLHHEFTKYLTPYTILIDHDVKLAATAEIQFIPKFEEKSVFFLYVGDGVGGALSIGEHIYSGAHGFAGEIGQMIIQDGTRLEQLLSWTTFVQRVSTTLGLTEAEAEGAADELEALVFSKSNEEDAAFLQELGRIAEWFSVAITNIAWLYNPNVVLIGGSYNRFGDKLLRMISEGLRHRLMPELFESLTLGYSHFQEKSSLVGAAIMTRDYWLEHLDGY